MPMKKSLGIAILLLSARAFGIDRATPQVRIETKFVEVGPGVISADFGLNFGHVYANFPSDMAEGDRVSGSIAAIPAGKSDAERSANLAALQDLGIRIGDVQVPVSAGLFVYPRVSPGRMDVQLLVGVEPIGRLFIEPKAATSPDQPAFILPVAGVELGRSRVLGPFGGDLTGTSIRVGDAVAHLVAESPRSCIFDVPAGPAGPGRMELRDGARTESGPFRIIGLRLTPPKPIIHTGDTTSFAAEVYGLAVMERPLSLVVRNLSTDVVSMEGGEKQTITIDPAKVSPSGTFAISRRLAGLHRGNYVVNVSVPWEEAPIAKERARAGDPAIGERPTGQKGISLPEAMEKLPKGYRIVKGEHGGFHAELDSLRPSLPLAWDEAHHVWTPPGYVPDPTDPERAFNQTTGGNAVWDDKAGRWIDAKTGNFLSYEQ
jgi:hypothetical protein